MSYVRRRLADLRVLDALLLTSLLWFLAKFVRYAFPPLFETFRGEYGVTPATLGLLYSALMVAYAAMQFPSGALADRLGPTRVIVGGALVASAAALLLFSLQALPVLVAAMVLIGFGTGVHKTVAIDLLAAVYPERTGRSLGIMEAIAGMSGVLAPAVVVALLSAAAGWHLLFLGAGVAGVALAGAFYARVPRRLPGDDPAAGDAPREGDGNESGNGGRGAADYLAAFADPRFALFVGAAVAFAFAWNGVLAFLPLYLTTGKGLATGRAGLVYSGLFLVSLIQPATGAIADRIGRYPVMAAATVAAAAGVALLVAGAGTPAVVAAVALIGIGGHGFRPPRDSHMAAAAPSSVSGGTVGIVRTAMMGMGAAAPAVVGSLSSIAGFAPAFGLLAGGFSVGVVLVVASALAPG